MGIYTKAITKDDALWGDPRSPLARRLAEEMTPPQWTDDTSARAVFMLGDNQDRRRMLSREDGEGSLEDRVECLEIVPVGTGAIMSAVTLGVDISGVVRPIFSGIIRQAWERTPWGAQDDLEEIVREVAFSLMTVVVRVNGNVSEAFLGMTVGAVEAALTLGCDPERMVNWMVAGGWEALGDSRHGHEERRV